MKLKKYISPKNGDTRIIKRFLLFPRYTRNDNYGQWLCWVKIKQRYEIESYLEYGWYDLEFVKD